MHGKALRRRWEFFLGGNTGTAMWAALARVELGRRNLTYEAEHVRCALRHLLRPSAAVLAAMARLRPGVSTPPPPPSASSSSLTAELTVGIHVRAEAHLIDRREGRDGAFHATLENEQAADRTMCRPGSAGTAHILEHFGEYWVAARVATALQGSRLLQGSNLAAAETARWLLVSDSAVLKAAALARWPRRVRTMPVRPSHILCGHGADLSAGAERRVETVAELLLLAESRVLVIGKSRFAFAALLLSACAQAYVVLLAKKGCRNGAATPPPLPRTVAKDSDALALPPGPRHAPSPRMLHGMLVCLGGGPYTAMALQDGSGRFLKGHGIEWRSGLSLF